MRLSSMGVCLALVATWAGAADGVSVKVTMSAPDALEVRYELPPTCTQLGFVKDGPQAAAIRARWQAQDSCASAGGDTLDVKETCPVVRFRVPATTEKISGYPGSFPVGRALYAHMSNYAVGPQCGPVQYHIAAPGGVASALGRSTGEVATGDDAAALLFPAGVAPDPKGLDYFDPALSPAAVTQIRNVANGSAAFLRDAMPLAEFKRPIIAASLASAPGGPNIGGSAGDVLLLTMFNWPASPKPEHQRLMNKLVAHEMSHRFQLRDAVDDYADARLIHEGGAEFLRWSVSLRQGWLTPQQAAAELDEALTDCVLTVGERSWRELSPRIIAGNHLEYTCGLPAFVYALAARQGKGSPYARIDSFYQQLRSGGKPDFVRAIECGATPCRPRVLPVVLGPQTPLHARWALVLRETGLATPRPPNQSQTNRMMVQALTQLMMDDCGNSSMTPTPGSVLLDVLPACKTLKANVEVVKVEGQAVFGGTRALPALVAACTARKEVELGIKGGASLRMPCVTPYQVTPLFYAANIEAIIKLLARE
ncbi:MAG: hypothetical protein ACJ8GW_09470 [Massilia sp.]